MEIILLDVRLSFPDLWEPVRFKGQGKARYSASFLIEPGSENDKKVLAAINAAAKEKWGDKAESAVRKYLFQPGKSCYMEGNTKEYDGYEGMMVLSAHRNSGQLAPKVIDRAKRPLSEDFGLPYPGCYVNAKVDIWAQTGDYTGIRASLNVVQFVRDGEPFSGSIPNDDDMPALDEGVEDDLI